MRCCHRQRRSEEKRYLFVASHSECISSRLRFPPREVRRSPAALLNNGTFQGAAPYNFSLSREEGWCSPDVRRSETLGKRKTQFVLYTAKTLNVDLCPATVSSPPPRSSLLQSRHSVYPLLSVTFTDMYEFVTPLMATLIAL